MTSRPTLPRWPKWLGRGLLVLGASLLVVAAANLVSYLRFKQAWNLDLRVDEAGLRKLVDEAVRGEAEGGSKTTGADVPEAFRKIGARTVSFSPGTTDAEFYRLSGTQHLVIWMRIKTAPDDPSVTLISNLHVPQRQKVLWQNPSPRVAAFEPKDWTLILEENGATHRRRSWIVRPQELRVVDRFHQSPQDDKIVETVALSEEQRHAIEAAAAAIPPSVRGHYFTTDVSDGLSLSISIKDDGTDTKDGIVLDNAWREEVSPLLHLISSLVMADHAMDFENDVKRKPLPNEPSKAELPQRSYTWAEWHALQRRFIGIPWWCVWPWFLE